MKKFLESINLKKFIIILIVVLAAIVSLLTASSVILNNKANDATLSNVEPSTKAIISTSDENFEEQLSSEEVEYTKIGNTTYVINYSSSTEAQTAMQEYAEDENITTSYDAPFEVAGSYKSSLSKTYKLDTIPDGMTLRDYADSVGKKVVAVIDTGVSSEYASASKNFTDESDSDENGHGTEVAKTILDNSDGKAIILSLKALGKDGTGYMSSIMQAVQYAREQHVDVINMSCVGYDYGNTDLFKELVKNAIADGIKVVAAAGNYNVSMIYFLPNSIDGVISVGAIDEEANKIDISNYNANYYEVAETTSQAAAIYSGKFVSGMDMSNEKTESDITYTEDTEQGELLKAVVASGATHIAADSEKKEVKYALDVVKIGEKYYYLYNNEKEFYSEWPIITEEPADYYFTIPKDGETFIASSKYISGYTVGEIHFRAGQHGEWSASCYDGYQLDPTGQRKRGNFDGYYNVTHNSSNDAWYLDIYLYPDDGYTYPDGWNSYMHMEYYWSTGTVCLNGVLHGQSSRGLDNCTVTIPEFKLDKTTYRVTYNGNGGNPERSYDERTVTVGSQWTVNLPNASRTYYNFKGWGWSNDNNANVGAAYHDATFNAGNQNVYAAWEGKWVNIQYEGNGGWSVPGNQGTRYGTYIYLSSQKPTRTGYTFKNWNTSASATPGQSDTSHILYNPGQRTYMAMSWENIVHDNDNQTITLYAIWEENSYTLTYDLNKPGSTTPSGDTSSQTYKYTQTFNVHGAPSCTGYIFQGWNTKKDGSGTSYAANQGFSFSGNNTASNIKLYAQWKPIKYNVYFDANGGQYVRYNNNSKANQSVARGSETNQYVGGTTSSTTFTFDQTKALPNNGYSWAGHTFLGWSENKYATSATYTNAKQVTNLRSNQGDSITLYAIWKAGNYTLTVNPVSGSGTWNGSSSSQKGQAETYTDGKGNTKWGDKVILGDAIAVNKSATITYNVQADDAVIDRTSDTVKWMFSRWIVSNGSTGIIKNNSARANDGSHDNGGTTYYIVQNHSDTVTAAYYWQTVKLPTPTREGYTFLGWYYDAACTDKVDGRGKGKSKYPLDSNGVERTSEFRTTGNGGASFRTEGNVTLYARWQKNSFNYADTEQVFMQDKINDDKNESTKIGKVDSITGEPITGTSSDQAIIEIYKGSVSASNKVLILKTGEGLFTGTGQKIYSTSQRDSRGFYDCSQYVKIGNKYIVHEVQAKSGYSKFQDYTLNFEDNLPARIVIENTPIQTSFKAYKVDSEGNRMNGAVFRLDDTTSGKTVGTFTSRYDKEYGNGFLFDGDSVTAGHTYSLVETSAPEGWSLASKVTFTVPEYSNGTLSDIVVTNKRKFVDLTIKKIDSKDNPVEGTTFQLYTMDEDGEYQKVYTDANGNWIANDKVDENSKEAIGTTNASGVITFKQIPQTASYSGSEEEFTKSYYLKEVKAADGMSLVQDYMKITIPNDGSKSFTYTVQDDSVTLTLEAGGNGMNPYFGIGIIGIAIAIALSFKKKIV